MIVFYEFMEAEKMIIPSCQLNDCSYGIRKDLLDNLFGSLSNRKYG